MKVNNFYKFIELVALDGKIKNNDAIFNIQPDSIKTAVNSEGNEVVTRATLKGKFTDMGEIGIGDLEVLKKLLKNFPEELDFKRRTNKIYFTCPSLKASCVLINPDYVKQERIAIGFDKAVNAVIDGSIAYSLESDILKNIVSYYKTIHSESIIFKSTEDKISIEVGSNRHEIISDISLPDKINEFALKFGKALVELFDNIKSESVKVYMKDSSPAYFIIETKNTKVEYLVYPQRLAKEKVE